MGGGGNYGQRIFILKINIATELRLHNSSFTFIKFPHNKKIREIKEIYSLKIRNILIYALNLH